MNISVTFYDVDRRQLWVAALQKCETLRAAYPDRDPVAWLYATDAKHQVKDAITDTLRERGMYFENKGFTDDKFIGRIHNQVFDRINVLFPDETSPQ